MPSLGESIEERASLPGSKTTQLAGSWVTKKCEPKNVQPWQSGCLLQILTLEIFALHACIPCPEDLRKMLSDDSNRESRGQLQGRLLSLPGKILKTENIGEKFHFLGVFHESGSVRSFVCVCVSHSVMSDSLRPQGL